MAPTLIDNLHNTTRTSTICTPALTPTSSQSSSKPDGDNGVINDGFGDLPDDSGPGSDDSHPTLGSVVTDGYRGVVLVIVIRMPRSVLCMHSWLLLVLRCCARSFMHFRSLLRPSTPFSTTRFFPSETRRWLCGDHVSLEPAIKSPSVNTATGRIGHGVRICRATPT